MNAILFLWPYWSINVKQGNGASANAAPSVTPARHQDRSHLPHMETATGVHAQHNRGVPGSRGTCHSNVTMITRVWRAIVQNLTTTTTTRKERTDIEQGSAGTCE